MNNIKEGKLAPCPFCGGNAFIGRKGDARKSTIIMCNDCGCTLECNETFNYGSQWNTRDNTELEAARAVVEAALVLAEPDKGFGLHNLGLSFDEWARLDEALAAQHIEE